MYSWSFSFAMQVETLNHNDKSKVVFKYSTPARLIPLFLSIEVFLFGFLFTYYPPYPFHRESFDAIPFFIQFKILIMVLGCIIAAWIVRFFFHMRYSFELRKDSLTVLSKRREKEISYDLIDSIDYENMLGPNRGLFGSTIIRARIKGSYRIYNVMKGGDQFIRMFVQKVCAKPFERKDLESWVEIRKIDKKMGRSAIYISIWYSLMGIAFIFFMVKGYLL